MKVKFRKSFENDIDTIGNRLVLNKILAIIEDVEQCNRLAEVPNIKKMKGAKNYFRIRTGDYRIGIYLDTDTVEFVRVLSRDKIYKVFPG